MVQIPNAYAKRGSTLHDVAAVNSTPTMFELLIAHSAGLEDNDALYSAVEAVEMATLCWFPASSAKL